MDIVRISHWIRKYQCFYVNQRTIGMIDTITIYVDMTLFLPSVVLFAALPDDQNLGEININNIQCLLKSYIGGQICASGG